MVEVKIKGHEIFKYIILSYNMTLSNDLMFKAMIYTINVDTM